MPPRTASTSSSARTADVPAMVCDVRGGPALEFGPHLYADGSRLNERRQTGLIGAATVGVVLDTERVRDVIAVHFHVVVSIVHAEVQLQRVVHRQLDVRFDHGDGWREPGKAGSRVGLRASDE